jgi:hypothetical protein
MASTKEKIKKELLQRLLDLNNSFIELNKVITNIIRIKTFNENTLDKMDTLGEALKLKSIVISDILEVEKRLKKYGFPSKKV